MEANDAPELTRPRFNSNDEQLRCQILKLSSDYAGCTFKTEKKEVAGGVDEFLMYSLFEPRPAEPTVLPYTDEVNTEDTYLLSRR